LNLYADVLALVLSVGHALITSGAEVTRVEDTIARIAHAYQIYDVEVFATPTGLFVSLGNRPPVTGVKRVRNRAPALDRVGAINALSRRIAADPQDPNQYLAEVEAILKAPPPLPGWLTPPLWAFSAATSTMLVGGTLSDFLPAFLANLIAQEILKMIAFLRLPEAVGDFTAGFMAVLFATLFHRLTGAHVEAVVAGGIMILVPGTAFTTTVRDAIAGDLGSASARAAEVLLKVVSLAAGVGAALALLDRGW
jgi:uncharacterized membrane protein YjjP (DUF1212 family)